MRQYIKAGYLLVITVLILTGCKHQNKDQYEHGANIPAVKVSYSYMLVHPEEYQGRVVDVIARISGIRDNRRQAVLFWNENLPSIRIVLDTDVPDFPADTEGKDIRVKGLFKVIKDTDTTANMAGNSGMPLKFPENNKTVISPKYLIVCRFYEPAENKKVNLHPE